jgi:hypothetical protein
MLLDERVAPSAERALMLASDAINRFVTTITATGSVTSQSLGYQRSARACNQGDRNGSRNRCGAAGRAASKS